MGVLLKYIFTQKPKGEKKKEKKKTTNVGDIAKAKKPAFYVSVSLRRSFSPPAPRHHLPPLSSPNPNPNFAQTLKIPFVPHSTLPCRGAWGGNAPPRSSTSPSTTATPIPMPTPLPPRRPPRPRRLLLRRPRRRRPRPPPQEISVSGSSSTGRPGTTRIRSRSGSSRSSWSRCPRRATPWCWICAKVGEGAWRSI